MTNEERKWNEEDDWDVQHEEFYQQGFNVTEVTIPKEHVDSIEVNTNEFIVTIPEDPVDKITATPVGCNILVITKPNVGNALIHIGTLAEDATVRDLLVTTRYRYEQRTGQPWNEAEQTLFGSSDKLQRQIEQLKMKVSSTILLSTQYIQAVLLSLKTKTDKFTRKTSKNYNSAFSNNSLLRTYECKGS